MKRAVRRPDRLAVGMMLASLIAGPPDRLTAQSQQSVASLPVSTRSAGLAGAGVALVGDAGSVFANPAGLATIHRIALEGSYEEHPGGTILSAAAAVRVGQFDYGLAAQALRPPPASAAATDVLALSALVFRYGMIAVGTSLKYVRQGVAAPQVDVWAGDAGVAIALFDILALGASVQNLGGDLGAGAHLPRRTRVGFTMNYVDPQGSVRLLTTLEGQWPEGRPAVLVAGAEAGLFTGGGIGIVARVGVSGRASATDVSPVAVGAGVALGRLQFDYAYRSYAAPTGAMHRFGARWGH
jgi:hypothetical protein